MHQPGIELPPKLSDWIWNTAAAAAAELESEADAEEEGTTAAGFACHCAPGQESP